MSANRQMVKVQKKRKRRRRVVMWIIVPLLVLVLGATAYGAFLYSKAQTVIEKSYEPVERESTKRDTAVDPGIDNVSILFVGVDDSSTRNFSSSSRSDALMLATLNEKTKSVKLLSIPRDSYVYIPELGYNDKITHAHANGGVATTIETVEEMLDIPVDYYVKMNFNAFIDVINALEGIEVEVPYELSEKDSEDRNHAINLEPGLQELNGEEALALARTRKLDNDIERGKRQQEILKAIVKKGSSVKSVSKYADVMEAVGDNMSTDLSFDEMKSFINYAAAGTSLDIETLNLAGQDAYIDGIYYYQLDDEELDQTILTLKEHLELIPQGSSETDTDSTVSDDSGEDSSY